jgi:hypothetical protein
MLIAKQERGIRRAMQSLLKQTSKTKRRDLGVLEVRVR